MTIEEIDKLKELLVDGMVEAVAMRETGFDIDTAAFATFLMENGVAFAEPVKHGRWIRPEGFYWRPECSECGYYGSVFDEPIVPFNYCPNCGAKMTGDAE